jgi:hypothetical protein
VHVKRLQLRKLLNEAADPPRETERVSRRSERVRLTSTVRRLPRE